MRINLLPAEYRPLPLFDSKRILLMVIGSFLVCCSIFTTVFYYFQANSSEYTLNSLNQQWDSLQSEKKKIEDLEKRLVEIKKHQDEVASIKKSYPDYIVNLNKISDSLVDDLWLNSVVFSPGKIDLAGKSMSFSIIGDFLKYSDKQGFLSVRLKNVTEKNDENLKQYDFSLEIKTQEGGVDYAQK